LPLRDRRAENLGAVVQAAAVVRVRTATVGIAKVLVRGLEGQSDTGMGGKAQAETRDVKTQTQAEICIMIMVKGLPNLCLGLSNTIS
jgi:hypothetical protein